MKNLRKYFTPWQTKIGALVFACVLNLLAFENAFGQICQMPTSLPENSAPNLYEGEAAPGAIYVRIYFYVVEVDGYRLTDDQVKEALAVLERDFAPHDIFFVWDCQPIVVSSIFGLDPSSFPQNSHSDGIDIFLWPDAPPGTPGGGGTAYNYGGSKKMRVNGNYHKPPYGTLFNSTVVSHEMGHCLDLYHTHNEVAMCAEYVNGSNSATCGDYVNDTPADSDIGFCLDAASCTWTGTPFNNWGQCNLFANGTPVPTDPNGDPYSPDETIIMSYSSPDCVNHFTAQQGQRMRNALVSNPVLIPTLAVASAGITTHIFQDITYSTPMDMPGDIIVHSGYELTISTTIRMAWAKKIVVEKGARLKVISGTVTRGCGSSDWLGIEVVGNGSSPQPDKDAPLNNHNQPGIVWLEHANVEWARLGVQAGSVGKTGGGLVWASGTTFANNRTDAYFASYAPTPTTQNKGYFFDCDFQQTDAPLQGLLGVRIDGTNGIEFKHCRFKGKQREGIRTFDASIKVTDGSEFAGNEYGISAHATIPMSSSNMDVSGESKFTDNEYHIYASLLNNIWGQTPEGKFGLNIINNDFKGGQYGVVMVGASTFQIAGNLFQDMPMGTFAANTGLNNPFNNNFVACNRFRGGTSAGILAMGDNREMQFLGNAFEMAAGNDFVLMNSWIQAGANGRIRGSQGQFGSPADNCFTDPNAQNDILTFGLTNHFSYFVNSEAAPTCLAEPETPGNYSKVFTPDLFPIVNCADFGGLPPGAAPPIPGDLDTRRTQIQALLPFIATDSAAQANYYRLLQEKDFILRTLLREALNSGQYTTAEGYLAGEQTKGANQAIYGLKVRHKAYAEARNYLNALPVEDADDAWFNGVQQINLDRLEAVDSFSLTEVQTDYLVMVAESQSSVREYARGLLSLLKDIRYPVDDIEIGNPEERGQLVPVAAVQTNRVKAAPLPASSQVHLSWPLVTASPDARLLVTDVFGRQATELHIAAGETAHTLDVSGFATGLYFVTVMYKGKPVYKGKFIVQH